MQKHSLQALGTHWWIEVFDDITTETFGTIMQDTEGFISLFERRFSRFIATSDISILNRERVLSEPNSETLALLTYGKNLYLRTNTHFNILTGHILEARGYDSSYSFTPTPETELTAGNPISNLLLSSEQIELTHGNVDLGGYGKGYLIDAVARLLQDTHNLKYLLIHAGGDMYATSNHGEPLNIYLEHPLLEKQIITQTTLLNQGFAASSPYKRQWKSAGATYSHIVAPAVITRASFIKHDSAGDADAFATTALLTKQKEMEQLSGVEHFGLAYYNPDTNQLISNPAFGL